ncbi:MAG: hypothetical protein IKV99_03005 [Oscillospiraceae bacterium]|nr:hypothetical protein [Oscillospiraceae bacterium]
MKRSRLFSFCLVLMLSAVLLLSGCGGTESTPAVPSDSEEPPPAPVLAEDDVTLPSIMSFANYELEPEGEKDRDGYTTVFYDLWRDDAFTQEYLDLLTENYHFSLRSSAPYREGVDKYLDGAEVYYLDYTGTAPIVGFSNNTTSLGEVHDVDLVIVAKKTGFAIHFADGLVWTDTDERSVIFADPIIPTDADYILPSIESFSNYQLWPKEEHEKDGYTILFYDLKRDDTFVQEYVDLLTEQYHFSLRLTAPYRAGVDDNYFAGADVYYFDYTGTEPIVGFTSKATDVEGVHDVEVAMVIRKNGFSINFADGLAWLYTDEYSTVFGGSEPQQPPKDGGYGGDDDDDRRPRRCAVCGGSGEVDCNSCGGSGEKDCTSCSGKGYTEEYVSTPNYSGYGSSSSTERVRCFSCGGDGEDDCYACRGNGEKDCPSCGGSGER